MLEQVEQLVVGPVDVLDQDHGGPLCRGCRQKLRPRVLEAVARGQWMEVPGDVEAERQPEDLPVAEQLASPLGWIALEQPEVLTQHLAQRPVRDPRAVRQAPSLQVRHPLAGQAATELVDQPGLAHPRLPDDPDDLSPTGLDLGHRVPQGVELVVPADEAAHLEAEQACVADGVEIEPVHRAARDDHVVVTAERQ